jgi:hypothetical protein
MRTSNGHTGPNILLTLSIVGVLGISWGVYSHWSGNPEQIAEKPAETKGTFERRASPPNDSLTHPVERAPIRSERPAFEQASAERPDPRAVPDESFTPCDEPATELAVLQALDEPDDEARYQRLQETVGGGAEVPVDRMHEVLVTDPSEKVRELALNALTGHPDATPEQIRAVAEGALANQSQAVRARAQLILDEMNELERIDGESRQILQIQSAM